MAQPLTHLLYPSCPPEEADACAWIFASADKFEKYYYKLPELRPNDVRARVLYASLCHSDSMTGRGSWGSCLYPCCPGHEVAAEVIAVGPAVTNIKVKFNFVLRFK
jgi:D-arabinose 1-dehydrogenase-like Zn-dependent alcohol dehydrogenase